MSDKIKISQLELLASVDNQDQIVVLDVSDLSQSPEGTTKRAKKSDLGLVGVVGPAGPGISEELTIAYALAL